MWAVGTFAFKFLQYSIWNIMPDGSTKVLIVEDDKFSQMLLFQVLASYNIDSLLASNGQEALNILKSEVGITHIALDLNMPVMDGYEFLKNIENMQKENVKIYITSCNGRESFIESIGESNNSNFNISGYFMKPFAMTELAEAIIND